MILVTTRAFYTPELVLNTCEYLCVTPLLSINEPTSSLKYNNSHGTEVHPKI